VVDQDVNIVGVNGGNVPDWATEQTLEAMLDKVDELVKITKSQRDVLKKGIKGGSSGGSDSPEEKEKTKKTKEASNLLGQLSSDLVQTHAGFDKLTPPMRKYLDNLKKTNKAGFAMIAGFGLIANQATKAVVSIGEQVSTLRDLADGGVQLQGSFMEMSRGLAEVGMTVGEFGEMAGKYARVIGIQGFQAVSRLSSAVNEAEGGFSKWGMTQKEGIEIAAEMLDQQRRAGLFRTINEQRESNRIAEVMDRLTAYSKVLNISREAMLESRKEMMNDAEVRFRMSQMTEEQRVQMEKGLGGTATALTALGADFDWVANLLKESAVYQINEQSQAWQDLAAAGFTPLANDLAALGDAAARGEQVTMEMVEATLRKYGQDKDFLESMFMAGGAAREYAMKIANASLTAEEAADMRKRLEERGMSDTADAVDENVQTMTAFQNEINQFIAAIEHMRVDAFMTLIGTEAEGGLKGATAALDQLTKKMLAFSDGPALENFRAFVVDNWQAIGAGILGAFAAWKLTMVGVTTGMAALTSKFGSLAKGIGAVGAVGAAGAAGYAVGTGINNIGKLWGGRQLSTTLLDTFTDHNDYDPNNDVLSPEQQAMVERARERRAENARQRQAAEAANATATSDATTEGSTAEAATPTMSPAEIASLSVGERQAYLLAELLRTNKKIARNISGDAYA
jgi:hypothetical protein